MKGWLGMFTALGLAGLGCFAEAGPARGVTRSGLVARDAWVRAHLGRARPSAAEARTGDAGGPRPGLLVLANHGAILRDRRPDGRPLQVGSATYEHGLLCHAPSRVVVRLPEPGARFVAAAGIDQNANGGSVEFSVHTAGRSGYRSGVVRFGDAPVAVTAELGGAMEFTLGASDAGDGIACDHALWAEARVTTASGRTLRLSEMPEVSLAPPVRTAATPPFSFWYGSRPSDEVLPDWAFREEAAPAGEGRTRRTQVYTDPATGVEVRCVSVTYRDYPTVEWTVTVRNTGAADSPVIQSLQALDLPFRRGNGGEFTLHRFVGSLCQENDFEPVEETLGPSHERVVSGAGGRPTNSDLCYFNLEWPGAGVIVALGWPGQWAARFSRDNARSIRLVAGQELTRMVLRPGEEVRTPLVALQFRRGGDWVAAQNVWRRWMVAHNLPRVDGKPVGTHYGGCWGNPLPVAEEEIAQATGAMADGVKLDYWFIDAGWYPNGGAWTNVGTWEPDPERFPRGLRQVADALHARGTRFIVWFEPERVTQGSWIAVNHPEWVLGQSLLNLGDPAARAWILDKLDGLIKQGGIDVYRSDFNIDPLPFWTAADTDDRIGMTENLYVQGFLSLWDGLMERNPGLWIDTCASGGRRNDLETLRRAVPLLRSDWAVIRFDREGAAGQQGQTYGLSFWMPLHGTGAPCSEPYVWRSSFCPTFRMGWDARDPNRDAARLRRAVGEFRQVERFLTGDYYPLTPYSLATDRWMAYQFHRPEDGAGVVQAFRRDRSPDSALTVRLRGLDRRARYSVRSLDGGDPVVLSGAALMREGFVCRSDERPGAVVYIYTAGYPDAPAGSR